MGTKIKESKMMKDLRRDRTAIIDDCTHVQMTTKPKKEYETKIVEKKCDRISDEFCSACAFPSAKWRNGRCNLATHLYFENKPRDPKVYITPLREEVLIDDGKGQKINPIKLSKRGG